MPEIAHMAQPLKRHGWHGVYLQSTSASGLRPFCVLPRAPVMRNRKRTGDGDIVFNPKRRLRSWNGVDDDIHFGKMLAKKVRYTGSPAHKRDPGDFNLTPPAAPRKNATLCDDAGVSRRKEAIRLLKDGARMGLVDGRSDGEFPLLIWSVRRDGVVFEAELENRVRGEYHGYPMPIRDPFRAEVLRAFEARDERD